MVEVLKEMSGCFSSSSSSYCVSRGCRIENGGSTNSAVIIVLTVLILSILEQQEVLRVLLS